MTEIGESSVIFASESVRFLAVYDDVSLFNVFSLSLYIFPSVYFKLYSDHKDFK